MWFRKQELKINVLCSTEKMHAGQQEITRNKHLSQREPTVLIILKELLYVENVNLRS